MALETHHHPSSHNSWGTPVRPMGMIDNPGSRTRAVVAPHATYVANCTIVR
jgi:hypothetical protein